MGPIGLSFRSPHWEIGFSKVPQPQTGHGVGCPSVEVAACCLVVDVCEPRPKNVQKHLTSPCVTCKVQVMTEREIHHYTKDDWLRCHRCDNPMPPEFWHRSRGKDAFIYEDEVESPFPLSLHQTDGGMTLIFEGGYGMFNDPMSEESRQKFVFDICHDCMVLLLDFFPEKIRDRFLGGHPAYHDKMPIEDRCCRYAWCFSDDHESTTGVLTGE